MKNNFFTILGLSAGLVFSIAFFFVGSIPVLATENLEIDNRYTSSPYVHTSIATTTWVGQTFMTGNWQNISKVIIGGCWASGTAHDFDLAIFKGSCTGTICVGELVHNDIYNVSLPTCGGAGSATITLSSMAWVEPNTEYYFSIESTDAYKASINIGTYANGKIVGNYNNGEDLYFGIYADDEYYNPNWNAGSWDQIPEEYLDMVLMSGIWPLDPTICQLNLNCDLQITYDPDLAGQDVWAVPDIDGQRTPNYAIASGTIPLYDNDTWWYLNMPTQSEATTTEYCLYTTTTEGNFLSCGYRVIYQDWLEDFDWSLFDADPCAGVASSSGTYADDFRYGIECAGYKLLDWLLQPSADTVVDTNNRLTQLKTVFPFTIYADVELILNDFMASTTSATSVPAFEFKGEVGDFGEFTFFSTAWPAQILGTTWTEQIRPFMGQIIYFIYFCYIFGVLLGFNMNLNRAERIEEQKAKYTINLRK